jgi:hypothetical protein
MTSWITVPRVKGTGLHIFDHVEAVPQVCKGLDV